MLLYNNGDITDIPRVSGTYSIGQDVTGMPFSGGCLAQVVSDGHSVAITIWYGNTQYIRVGSGEIWDDWDIFATVIQPQQFDLPLYDGISADPAAENSYSVDQFGRVMVHFCVSRTDGIAFDPWQNTIATLPEGFKPDKWVYGIACCSEGDTQYPVISAVTPGGNVLVFVTDISARQTKICGAVIY